MLCRENAICRPQSGRFLRAEGYSKRCCQFEFVAAERRILTPKKAVARKTMPHGPVMYITIYSRRAALWDGPYDAAIRPQKQATNH